MGGTRTGLTIKQIDERNNKWIKNKQTHRRKKQASTINRQNKHITAA